jgi:hypothetical protein
MTDPRSTWTENDWFIAYAYFGMLECKPPRNFYKPFIEYTSCHKPVTLNHVENTITSILRYRHEKWDKTTRSIANMIQDFWQFSYKMAIKSAKSRNHHSKVSNRENPVSKSVC